MSVWLLHGLCTLASLTGALQPCQGHVKQGLQPQRFPWDPYAIKVWTLSLDHWTETYVYAFDKGRKLPFVTSSESMFQTISVRKQCGTLHLPDFVNDFKFSLLFTGGSPPPVPSISRPKAPFKSASGLPKQVIVCRCSLFPWTTNLGLLW